MQHTVFNRCDEKQPYLSCCKLALAVDVEIGCIQGDNDTLKGLAALKMTRKLSQWNKFCL